MVQDYPQDYTDQWLVMCCYIMIITIQLHHYTSRQCLYFFLTIPRMLAILLKFTCLSKDKVSVNISICMNSSL